MSDSLVHPEVHKQIKRAFFDIAEGLVFCDLEGRVGAPNPAFCRLIGRKPEALIDLEFAEVVADRDRSHFQGALRGVARRWTPTIIKLFLTRGDGSDLPVWIKLSRREIEGDSPDIVLLTVHETQQQQLEPRDQLSERLKELRCILGLTDAIGRHESVESLCEGLVRSIPAAWQYPEIARARLILDGAEYLSDNFQESPWSQTTTIEVYDQPRGTIEVYYIEPAPELDEGPFMTEERELLEGVSRILAGAIRRFELEAQQEALERALRAKIDEQEQVMYVVSHDLRSPLVNIIGYASELGLCLDELIQAPEARESRKTLEADIQDSLKYIKASAARMDALLAGLLKLSRTGRAPLYLDQLDVNRLVRDVADEHAQNLKLAGASIEIGELPVCHADETQLGQALSNLLGNAIKYRSPDRPSHIKITGFLDDEESVYCVEDNGIGIAEEHQQKIFDIFQQLGPRDTDGDGLGLTIVQRVMDRMMGAVRVESELGRGSRFKLRLPTNPPNGGAQQEELV